LVIGDCLISNYQLLITKTKNLFSDNALTSGEVEFMSTGNQQRCCPICGYTLTLDAHLLEAACTDPGHWQAAGLLSSNDYYPMAQIMARSALTSDSSPDHLPHRPGSASSH
jgi:hypothetical protein